MTEHHPFYHASSGTSTTSQEAAIIVTIATQIYEAGAAYRSVEPNMYEVTPDNGCTTLMSAAQFHAVLSLVRSLKSVVMGVQL